MVKKPGGLRIAREWEPTRMQEKRKEPTSSVKTINGHRERTRGKPDWTENMIF